MYMQYKNIHSCMCVHMHIANCYSINEHRFVVSRWRHYRKRWKSDNMLYWTCNHYSITWGTTYYTQQQTTQFCHFYIYFTNVYHIFARSDLNLFYIGVVHWENYGNRALLVPQCVYPDTRGMKCGSTSTLMTTKNINKTKNKQKGVVLTTK